MSKNKAYLNFDRKLVTRIPLNELWDQTGFLGFERDRFLKENEVKELISTEDLQFVVADISQQLKWLDKKAKFKFWKNELKDHLCENPATGCQLEDFKEEYFYFASLWTSNTEKVIVIEKHH